ncbi:hypothetical protein [Natrinema sp. H-ect4]|uniref:DUF7289 family protein n=1 Tax=Natrinema sp. H-ect4 TaxID=3242699 RepID=UPI0035A85087
MADKERCRWGDTRDRDTRAASPLVGIILLFALVMIGAMLVFVAGSAMFDAIQSEADREQTQQFMLETDHRLSTVAETKTEQVLPEGVGPSDVNGNGGQIEVAWYANGSSSDPWSDASCSVNDSLGTLEYEQAGGTIAHQGGGVWETTNGQTRIVSEPDIGYDNDTLQLQILQLDNDDFGGSEAVARADHSKATDLTRRINNVSTRCNDRANVAIRIESEYHDGWHRFLEDSLGEDEYEGVTVTQTGDTVEARIEEIREPIDSPTLLIEEDEGVTDKPATRGDHVVTDGNKLRFNAKLNNTGNTTADASDGPMRVVIDGGAVVVDDGKGVPGGQTKLITTKVKPKQYEDVLTPGRTYEYTIHTLNGSGGIDDTLDEPGEFYLGKSGANFNVTNIETTPTGDSNVTINANVRNSGIENGTQNVMLDFPSLGVSDTEQLSLEYGATGSVSWTINESSLPSRSNVFNVETSDTDLSETIVGTGGSGKEAFIVVEDKGVRNGQIVSSDGPFTVEGTVQSTYAAEETRDVTLTIPDADVKLPKKKTLESSEEETVTFGVDPSVDGDFEPGTVYEYNIKADGDGLRTNGSFYFGEPGTHFELSNGSVDDDNVTIRFDIENTGIDPGNDPAVTLDLEYLDGETPDEYGRKTRTISEEFKIGQSGTIEWPLNESRLLGGEYRATVTTNDDSLTTTFNVSAKSNSGKTGIGVGEPVAANVTVLGTQVSTEQSGYSWTGPVNDHHLIPVDLSVVTESGGERTVHHRFKNKMGGDNINTYDSWQKKGGDEWTKPISIEKDDIKGNEVTLTLSSTSEQCLSSWCHNKETESGGYTHHYSDDIDNSDPWVDVDATADRSLQNVRVRTHKNDTVPELRAYHDLQVSADEILAEKGLWDNETQTLDLGKNEYIFLFEMTSQTDSSGTDSLWDDAQNTDGYGDPNFNDLIVYVDIERAGVAVGNPYELTLIPEISDPPEEATSGEGNEAGGIEGSGPTLEGNANDGVGPGKLESGTAGLDNDGSLSSDTGVNVDTNSIVIG